MAAASVTPPDLLWIAHRDVLAQRVAAVRARREQPGAQHEHADAAVTLVRDAKRMLADSKTWTFVKSSKGVSIYKAADPSGGAAILSKGEGVIEGVPPAQVLAITTNTGTRAIWDSLFETGRLVKSFAPDVNVVWAAMKGVMLVASRDLAGLSVTVVEPDGVIINAVRSIETPLVPPESGRVRMHVGIAAWILEPLVGSDGRPGTRATYLAQTDLKGWIPSGITATVAEMTPMCVEKVTSYISNRGVPPYMSGVCGLLNDVRFADAESSFALVFTGSKSPVCAPHTELHVPLRRYPNGVALGVTQPELFAVRVMRTDLYGLATVHLRLVPLSDKFVGVQVILSVKPAASAPGAVTLNGQPATVEPYVASASEGAAPETPRTPTGLAVDVSRAAAVADDDDDDDDDAERTPLRDKEIDSTLAAVGIKPALPNANASAHVVTAVSLSPRRPGSSLGSRSPRKLRSPGLSVAVSVDASLAPAAAAAAPASAAAPARASSVSVQVSQTHRQFKQLGASIDQLQQQLDRTAGTKAPPRARGILARLPPSRLALFVLVFALLFLLRWRWRA